MPRVLVGPILPLIAPKNYILNFRSPTCKLIVPGLIVQCFANATYRAAILHPRLGLHSLVPDGEPRASDGTARSCQLGG